MAFSVHDIAVLALKCGIIYGIYQAMGFRWVKALHITKIESMGGIKKELQFLPFSSFSLARPTRGAVYSRAI